MCHIFQDNCLNKDSYLFTLTVSSAVSAMQAANVAFMSANVAFMSANVTAWDFSSFLIWSFRFPY